MAGAWRPAIASTGGEAFARPASPPAVATESASSRLPFLLFCVLTFVVVGRPNDYIQALVPLRLALVMTAVTVVATFLFRRPGAVDPLRFRETKVYLAFFAVMCLGVPLAMHRGVSFEEVVLGYTSNIVYFLLFLSHVTTHERLRRIWVVLVVGAVLFSLVGLSQGAFVGGRYFAGGQMYDPNDVAYAELALLPFALCLLMSSASLPVRGLALVSVLLGMLLALYTGSRGGMLGIVTFVLLFVTLRTGRVRIVHKAILLALVIGAAALNADKINFDRYRTLTNLEDDYNLEEGGRWDVWKTGAQILLEYPLTGVGAGNFGMAIGNRRMALGETPRWQAPHNSVVQVFVELGVVSGALWVMLVGSTVRTLWRLRKQDHSANADPARSEVAVWSNLLLIGFVAQFVCSLFLSMGYSVFFPLFFAAAVVLSRISSDVSSQASPPPNDDRQRWPSLRQGQGRTWERRPTAR
jgi:O-antigen ligase